MLEKKITFTDYGNKVRTETHYFHLNKAEVIEFLTTNGDYTLDKLLKRLVEEHNGKEIMATFKDLIYRSYGKKSDDGRRFMKSKEIKDSFMETEAYSELFTELVTDGRAAADFINQIIPNDIASDIAKIVQENPEGVPAELKEYASSVVDVTSQATIRPV